MKAIIVDRDNLVFTFIDRISAGSSFSVNANLLEIIQNAIFIIWNNLIGKPHNIRILLLGEFSGHEKVMSAYDPLIDRYEFALSSMLKQNFLKHGSLFLLSAHEAYHNFQCLKGDPPPFFHENLDYANCPYEIKAWEESLDAFKAYHPVAKGSISLNGKDYFAVPEKSSYYL